MTHDFDTMAARVPTLHLSEKTKELHLEQFAAMMAGPPKRPRWWLRLGGFTFGVGAVAVGVAAAFGAFSEPPATTDIAHCYATADLSDPTNHTDFSIVLPESQGYGYANTAAQAMDACAGQWSQGRFSSTDPKVSDPKASPWNYPIPELQACLDLDGEVAIIPGPPSICFALGLADAQL